MTDRLLIEEAEDGSLRVSHQRDGAGFAEAQSAPFAFAPPLDGAALEDLRWYLEDYLIAPYAVYEDRGKAIEAKLDAWGEALFRAAFADEQARIAYERARDAERGASLSILGRSAGFLGLPWELLKDPERPDPLALSVTAIDRMAGSPARPAEIPPGDTLRVLMVIARPEGLRDVGYQMIARPLMERLEAVRGKVALEVLRPPTLEALAKRLFEAAGEGLPFHILHFDGHGTFGEGAAAGFGDVQFKGPQGYLAFEKPAGGSELVTAEDFARIVAQAKVPVVVLNACRSGTVAQGAEAATVEAAVATRLLGEGAASVVAMGYSVYAVAAAEFMAAFYEALFDGRGLSFAVAAGRHRMKTRPERPSPKGRLPLRDWIVPVHYTRRAVAFPGLKQARAKDAPDLDDYLDSVGEPDDAARLSDSLAPDRRFFGRGREFYTLELALRGDRVVLLRGTAGTGKTELAKAFGRWWRDTAGVDRPEWVLFHSFAPGTATFGLDAAVTEIGLAVWGADFLRKAATPAQREAAVLRLLRDRRLLLIWDNVESLRSMPDAASGPLPQAECDRLRRFLDELRAPGGRSGVILTSRAPEDWLCDGLRRIEIGGLDAEAAAELADDLLKDLPLATQRRKERSFKALMDWLEGHPLSLRVLLPKLETMPPAALLAALQGATASLPPGFEGEERTAHLGASLKLSLDQLDPEQRERALALALFEGVADEDVLAAFGAAPRVPPRFAGVTKAEWSALLDRLAAVGLVTRPGLGMADLHPALPAWMLAAWREAAGEGFDAERAAAERAVRLAYAQFGEFLHQQIHGGTAEEAFSLLDRQRRTIGRLLRGALAEGAWEEAQAMLRPLDPFLDARGLGPEARAWAQAARQAVEKGATGRIDFGGPAGELWLLAEASEANRALRAGDTAAAERAYDAMRRRLEVEGDEAARPRLAFIYHGLGIAAQERGDLAGAEGWYRRSLEIAEALDTQPYVAAITHQLGIVAQRRGDLPGAEPWFRRSLEIEEALGNRPGIASSYHQLGSVAQDRGDLTGAEGWYRRSLEMKEALGNRPGMVSSYHQLGIVAHLGGDVAGAEGWFRRSLEIAEALGDRPGMASIYCNLGVLAETRQQPETALDWTVRCVALFEEFPHPLTGLGPSNLAHLTRAQGWPALEAAWQRVAGAPLPDHVRAGVTALIAELPPD